MESNFEFGVTGDRAVFPVPCKVSPYVILTQLCRTFLFDRKRSVNTTLPVVTINHLKPSTRYVLHVAACDNEGPGSEMAQVAVETTSEGDDC